MSATGSSPSSPPDSCPADVTRLIRAKLVPVEATLDELRDLFTGVPAEDGGWATTPCYTVSLAFEIAKRAKVSGEFDLRSLLYDTTVVDDVPGAARDVIALAAQRYRLWRDLASRQSLGTAA